MRDDVAYFILVKKMDNVEWFGATKTHSTSNNLRFQFRGHTMKEYNVRRAFDIQTCAHITRIEKEYIMLTGFEFS